MKMNHVNRNKGEEQNPCRRLAPPQDSKRSTTTRRFAIETTLMTTSDDDARVANTNTNNTNATITHPSYNDDKNIGRTSTSPKDDHTTTTRKTRRKSMTTSSSLSPSFQRQQHKKQRMNSLSSSCSNCNSNSSDCDIQHQDPKVSFTTSQTKRKKNKPSSSLSSFSKKFENLKQKYKHLFCPLPIKACTLLHDEDYILSFVDSQSTSCGGDQLPKSIQGPLEDILFYTSQLGDHGGSSKHDSMHNPPLNVSLVQQLTRVLIDAMGFQIVDRQQLQQQQTENDAKGGSNDYILQPIDEKVPIERPSSFKNLVDLQIAILKSSSTLSTCRIMEDIAWAYRLAAHFMLKACHAMNQQHERLKNKHNDKDKSRGREMVRVVKRIQNRAALTLFVSLRSLYVDFLKEDGMKSNHNSSSSNKEEKEGNLRLECPVTKNICNFFRAKDAGTELTPAQILLIDCVSLLTDVNDDEDGGLGMVDHKRCMTLVEKILKLDKEFGRIRDKDSGCLWGGIMELFLRQLLAAESVFVRSNGPIKKYLEKLNQRHQGVSGALASVLLDMTPQCKIVMDEMFALRRVQLKRMVERKIMLKQQQNICASGALLNSSSYNQEDLVVIKESSLMSEDVDRLRMYGCIYLTKVLAVYSSQHQRPNHLGGQLLRDNVEQMAFYLFHFLMENENSSQKNEEGSVHPFSVTVRINVKSAALAALYLSTKINECSISMRRLITLSKSVTAGDVMLKSFKGTEPGVPYQNLIKTYERRLMMLHGYDAPEMKCLPFGCLSDIAKEFGLSPNDLAKYNRVFHHVGYKLSACCILDEPCLVALAVYYFGYKHLRILQMPCAWEDFLGKGDQEQVEILSDHMNAVYNFYLDRTENMYQSSNSTPDLKKDTLSSLSCVIDQINILK